MAQEIARQPDFGIIKTDRSPYARLSSVNLGDVRWTRGFWADRFAQTRDVTLPHLYDRLSDPAKGHVLANFEIAAGLCEGEFWGTHWHDAWAHKWLEAAAYVYEVTREPELDARMDALIDVIARAQQPDGYVATQTTVRGWARYQNPHHHEIYVMGHLLTAACIHHRVTGKRNYLDVAIKVGDYLYQTFRGDDPALAHFPINPSNIMGLVELYRTTGEARYLEAAQVFVDMRGAFPGGSDVNQDRVPLRQETQVVGHSVWYTYLYAGAADVCLETGETALLEVLDRLWRDLVETKLCLTGGVCPVHWGLSPRRDKVWEAAALPYDLPNASAYNETCGQIGNAMWNWRMLAATGEARYADVMEQAVYNILSGIGLDGASWWYTNPLRWYGDEHTLLSNDASERFQPGEKHICCPTNLLRRTASIHNYAYSLSEGALWVHLYGSNRYAGTLKSGERLALVQETDYPWEGDIEITIEEAPETPVSLRLRVPAWAQGATLTLNGDPMSTRVQPGTYAMIDRIWRAQDRLSLHLPLRVRKMEAHPHVEQDRNHVAFVRGPLTYCLESDDLPPGVGVAEVRIPRDIELTPRYDPSFLGGCTVLEGQALAIQEGDWQGALYREADQQSRPVQIRLIPYYAWANRSHSQMSVWLPWW